MLHHSRSIPVERQFIINLHSERSVPKVGLAKRHPTITHSPFPQGTESVTTRVYSQDTSIKANPVLFHEFVTGAYKKEPPKCDPGRLLIWWPIIQRQSAVYAWLVIEFNRALPVVRKQMVCNDLSLTAFAVIRLQTVWSWFAILRVFHSLWWCYLNIINCRSRFMMSRLPVLTPEVEQITPNP